MGRITKGLKAKLCFISSATNIGDIRKEYELIRTDFVNS